MRNTFTKLMFASLLVCVNGWTQPSAASAQHLLNSQMNNSEGVSAGYSSFKPREGYVPDEKTAIAIAVAVWIPIYGEKKVESEKPFKATLENGVWTVYGSLPKGYTRGGTVEAKISKDSGCILLITHGK